MKEREALEMIKDLRLLSDVYTRLLNDMKSRFYKCPGMTELRTKADKETLRLEELIENGECEDSYEQNTGRRVE